MWTRDRWDFERVLEGQRIKAIHMSEEDLFITTDKGVHKFQIEGDCCSHSYFHEILQVSQMLTWVAKNIEYVSLPVVEDGDDTLVQAYSYKFHTEGGYGMVVFRNESNGYYGGTMYYLGRTNEGLSHAREIREDWSA